MFSAFVLPVVIMLVCQVALPVYLIRSVWRARQDTRAVWWLAVASAGAYVTAFFLIGRWDWFSYYLRFALVALFVTATGAGLRRARALPRRVNGRRGSRSAMASALTVAAVMTWFTGNALLGLRHEPDEPVRLALPLANGAYYVAHGGDSSLLNHHNGHPAQRYALDIVQLNVYGARAGALFSTDVHQYAIFGAPVYSPCDGVVADAVDGLPDRVPPDADPQNPAGNHVVISCRGSLVHLAHLQSGSVKPSPGARVFSGQVIGRVGNSGNTSEPHLHVHAVTADGDVVEGEGKPILFDGLFPVRNSLLHR